MIMGKWHLKIRARFLIAALLLFLAITIPRVAQSADLSVERASSSLGVSTFNECLGLDLIFLIDQSASMGGALGNDPHQQRIESTQFAFEWLASNRLGLCREAVHQVAVLSFGGTLHLDLSPTTINPANFDEWNEFKQNIFEKLEPRNLGATDPGLAFLEAKRLFLDFPNYAGARKRVIIMLTDGQPDLSGEDFDLDDYMQNFENQLLLDFPFSEALLDRELQIDQAIAQYGGYDKIPDAEFNRILAQFPVTEEEINESTYIWFIAMNDRFDYLERIGRILERIANAHGGHLVDLENNVNEVPIQFNAFLSRLGGVPYSLIGCGDIPVEPYLSGLVIDIYTVGDQIDVQIRYKDSGEALVGGEGDRDFFGLVDYSDLGGIEHYVFEKPPAGLWQIDAAAFCDDVKVSFIGFNPAVSQIDAGAIVPQCPGCQHPAGRDLREGIQIAQQNATSGSDPYLNEDPNYPLTVTGRFTAPNGVEVDIPFTFSGNGVWQTAQNVPALVSGAYTFTATGVANCVDPANHPDRCPAGQFTVFEFADGFYQVEPVTELQMNIASPESGEIYSLRHFNGWRPPIIAPQEVAITFSTLSGEVLPLSQVLTSLQPFDVAEITYEGQTYPVVFEASQDGYTLQGFVEGLEQPGDYIFSLVPGNSFATALNYHEFGIADRAIGPIQFVRADTFFTSLIFYWILVVLSLLLALGIAWMIIYNLGDPVHGQLIFTSTQGTTTRNVAIKTRWRSNDLKRNKLPKDLGLTRLHVTNATPKGETQVIQATFYITGENSVSHTIDDGGHPRPVGQAWKVEYKWGGRAKASSGSGGRGRRSDFSRRGSGARTRTGSTRPAPRGPRNKPRPGGFPRR